jgi:hypothetical protein
VAAAVSNFARALGACGVCAVIVCAGERANAGDAALSDAKILGDSRAPQTLHVESIMTRVTTFEQDGHGYQSQAGPTPTDPGSERLTVLEPQVEITASQGPRLKHRLWLPVDVVTAASPDSIHKGPQTPDMTSGASRHVEGGSIDLSSTYKAAPSLDLTMRNGIHLENPFRSWVSGVGVSRGFADDDTVISANVSEVYDWFDVFDIGGRRHGRTSRSSTTGTIGVTQILTPTTIVHANYGVTLQSGELGNTWNSVPLATGVRGAELLPIYRTRHALVGRASQFLPWNGALRLYYRFYADDWAIAAHSIEAQLMQRISPVFYVGALYRFHTQTGASFYTELARLDASLRTADSDLARLDSHTIGGKVVADVPLHSGEARALHLELGYERYERSNDLWINVISFASGLRF